MITAHKKKLEYGDFQTPLELAEKVCQQLITLGVSPDAIIEPTCGVGHFIEAASHSFHAASRIIGIEINQAYIQQVKARKQRIQDDRIELQQADFFQFDWSSLIGQINGSVLVVGNFPWVTNAQQGKTGSVNLPKKSNFQGHSGLDAVTGRSNFDISEWMLIQIVQWLQGRDAYLAMLCKLTVARKILSYLHAGGLNLADCATYKIDAKRYFDADVEAGLLFCKFDSSSKNYFCNVFNSLDSSECHQIGYRDSRLIRDVTSFEKLSKFYDSSSKTKWRSGIKHDCSSVMELCKNGDRFINKLGETVEIEERYLFPLLKGSDIARSRTTNTNRYVLVTQKFIGESTESIRDLAPKTWQYLSSHAEYLENRKSKIYQNNPKFSIFGVGDYTFSTWKIAICGLYKRLDFKLIGQIDHKPVVFDDTVYFISFDDEQTALKAFQALTSQATIEFYSSLIFWDEKRPIKSSILNSLNLQLLTESGSL